MGIKLAQTKKGAKIVVKVAVYAVLVMLVVILPGLGMRKAHMWNDDIEE
jgi:hypothetical protein